MMEKVKLTQEQADAIEKALSKYSRDRLLKDFATANKEKFYTTWQPLRLFKFDDMAKILYIGYEVEEEYKVGDWVITKESGRIAKITRVAWNMVYGYWNNGSEEKWNRIDHIRHATPEEIKAEQERILWKSIDRIVGTFHLDDIYVDQKGMPFLITDTTHLASGIISTETAIEWHRIGNFKGLYPAESFVELSGEVND